MSDNVLSSDSIVAKPVGEISKPASKKRSTRKPRATTKSTSKPKLGIFPLYPDVQIPSMATDHAACFDMRAYLKEGELVTVYTPDNTKIQRVVKSYPIGGVGIALQPGERVMMPTGIIFDIPTGYSVRQHPRSGCSLKDGLTLVNGEGVIDSDYVNENFIPLINLSEVRLFIEHGERCAQAEMVQDLSYDIEPIQSRPKQKSNRTGGFGHSGKV